MLNSFGVMTTQVEKTTPKARKASGGASVLGMTGGTGTGSQKLLLLRPCLYYFIMTAQAGIVSFRHITGMSNAIIAA